MMLTFSLQAKENEGLGKSSRIPRFQSVKVDVPHPLFFSIKLALWIRDGVEVQAGPSISMTRSKHSVFIKQSKLDVANPFSSVQFSSVQFSSVVRIDEGNEGNEESHLTHHMLGPAL